MADSGTGMQFSLLGALHVERDGRTVDVGTPKQAALLVRLLLDAPRPVSVDRLIEDLWSGDPPGRATASLQAYVSNLRRVLEPHRAPRTPAAVLVTRPPGYLLRVPDDAVDVTRFRALAARAAQQHGDRAAGEAHASAVEALGLWRGPALLDVREEPFAAAAVTELEDLRLAVEEIRLAAALDLGREAEVATELEALVAAEPLRERLWELLVVALYRSGRPAAALARYRRVRRLLDDELGMEPGPRLQQLERAVLQHDEAVLRPGRPVRARPAGGNGSRTGAGDGAASGREPLPTARADGDAAPSGGPGIDPRLDVGGLVEAAAPGASSLDAVGRPPLAGRDALLDELSAWVLGARRAGPRWLLLTGEPGIGKTRMAEALCDRAAGGAWRVATARCHDDTDTPSFWLWAQVLRDLSPERSPADPLAPLAAAARAESGGDTARFALYDGLRRALVEAAGERPLLVAVDDLQWADGDSLRALRFLAVQLREQPVAVLATVRDVEGSGVLADVLLTVERQPGAERVALPPIDAEAVGSIAEALAGGPVDTRTAAELHARSGGNPFFATELARMTTTASGASALPHGVRDVVGRRLDRLPEEVRRILALAAVVGSDVDVATLAGAEGVDLPTMLDRLDPALATGVLTEDGGALRVRFAHALLRESLLAELTPPQRRRLHARVAAALQRRPGGTVSTELAHHLVEAGPMGDLRTARAAAVEVARRAAAGLAFDEAARWFGRALDVAAQLDVLEEPDPRGRHELLLARGDALFRSGQVVPARQELITAVEVAVAMDDLDAVAKAAGALDATGGVWTWVDLGALPPAVLEPLAAGLARLGDGDSVAKVRLLSTVATGLYYGADQEQVDALSGEAVTMARRLGDPRLLADALLDRSFAIRLPDRSTEVVELADEALAQPGVTDLQVVVGHGRRFYGLLHVGDLPAAVAAHRRAADEARRARLLVPQLQLGHFPAGLAIAKGRFADAERLIAEARTRDEQCDLPALALGLVGCVAMLAKHRERLSDVIGIMRAHAAQLSLRSLHQLLALGSGLDGDRGTAEAEWRASEVAYDPPWSELVADTLEVELREVLLPRPATAAPEDLALLRVLRAREGLIAAAGTAYPWLPVALPLAAHEHRLGLLDEAERHLRDCIVRCDSWGTDTWTALARWRLAAVLAERGDAGEVSASLRVDAMAAATRIGLVLPPLGWERDAHARR